MSCPSCGVSCRGSCSSIAPAPSTCPWQHGAYPQHLPLAPAPSTYPSPAAASGAAAAASRRRSARRSHAGAAPPLRGPAAKVRGAAAAAAGSMEDAQRLHARLPHALGIGEDLRVEGWFAPSTYRATGGCWEQGVVARIGAVAGGKQRALFVAYPVEGHWTERTSRPILLDGSSRDWRPGWSREVPLGLDAAPHAAPAAARAPLAPPPRPPAPTQPSAAPSSPPASREHRCQRDHARWTHPVR